MKGIVEAIQEIVERRLPAFRSQVLFPTEFMCMVGVCDALSDQPSAAGSEEEAPEPSWCVGVEVAMDSATGKFEATVRNFGAFAVEPAIIDLSAPNSLDQME